MTRPHATIALLCNDSTAEDTINAPSAINKNRIVDRCVQFLDGFEPECVVSRCNVDIFCHGRVVGEREGGSSTGYSCCLLQYQLDWGRDLEKSERTGYCRPMSIHFTEAQVFHLKRTSSDHAPLLKYVSG